MIEGALHYAIGAVSLALLLTCWRLLAGPSAVDRVLALDTLYVNTVALVILLGLRLASDLLFEAALVIALLGFIATVALARFVARGDVVE
jgi:multicomponent K+:H+ antiporter subunit F